MRASLQDLKRGGDLVVNAARVAGKVFGSKGLSGERRIGGRSSKGKVHLGGAAAEARGCLEPQAGVIKGFTGKCVVIKKAGGGNLGGSWEEPRQTLKKPES